MVVTLPQTSKMKTCVLFLPFFGCFLVIFLIFGAFPQKFDPKCLTWLESSGEKLASHTFPMFLGDTSKCPEFNDLLRNQLCTMAQSVSYVVRNIGKQIK